MKAPVCVDIEEEACGFSCPFHRSEPIRDTYHSKGHCKLFGEDLRSSGYYGPDERCHACKCAFDYEGEAEA